MLAHAQTMEVLADCQKRLNLNHVSPKIVTVTGTNGKSSVVHHLVSAAMGLGLQVGSFISPHVHDFRERVQINQTWVGDHNWCQSVRWVESQLPDIALTPFAWITLVAMNLFRHRTLDLLVLEVGMGGRLDPVNLWDADVAVVTNVALDHCKILGHSRRAISSEKMGILRPGQSVVLGEDDLVSYIKPSLKNQCKIYVPDNWSWHSSKWRSPLAGINIESEQVPSSLERHNIAMALMALQCLDWELVSYQPVKSLWGRRHWVNEKVCIDVAHNPAAVASFLTEIKASTTKSILAIFSTIKTKDYQAMIEIIQSNDISLLVTNNSHQHSIQACDVETLGLRWVYREYMVNHLTDIMSEANLILVFGCFAHASQFMGNMGLMKDQ